MDETFICLECGETFEEPKLYSEDLTPGGAFEGGSFIHQYYACPYCEGAYRYAVKCNACGKYIDNEKLEFVDHQYLCDECYEQLEEI